MKFLIYIIIITIFSVSCNSNNKENNSDDGDTAVTEIIQKVKKTRKQLIVNRDTIRIKNTNKPTDFELEHTPEISILKTDKKGISRINVIVGSKGKIHPKTDNHWIYFMTLYLDNKKFEHKKFENDTTGVKYNFFASLKKVKTVKIELGCNLHGIWSSEVKVNQKAIN